MLCEPGELLSAGSAQEAARAVKCNAMCGLAVPIKWNKYMCCASAANTSTSLQHTQLLEHSWALVQTHSFILSFARIYIATYLTLLKKKKKNNRNSVNDKEQFYRNSWVLGNSRILQHLWVSLGHLSTGTDLSWAPCLEGSHAPTFICSLHSPQHLPTVFLKLQHGRTDRPGRVLNDCIGASSALVRVIDS